MKKLNDLRKKKIRIIGLICLLFIGAMSYMSCQTNTGRATCALGVGLVIAFPESMKSEEKEALQALGDALNKEIDKLSKGYLTITKFEENVQTKMEEYLKDKTITKETFEELKDVCKNQGIAINELKENKNNKVNTKTLLADKIKEAYADEKVKSALKRNIEDKTSSTPLEIFASPTVDKAAAAMSTAIVTTDTAGIGLIDIINAMQDPKMLRLTNTFIENYCTTFPVSNPYHTYVDFIPKDGDGAFVAEVASFSLMDFKIEVRHAVAKKATAYEILSDESVQDVPFMQSVANNLLVRKTALNRQNANLFGAGLADGTGDEPRGITLMAGAFNPASWTGNKILNPNLLDVIKACANQIYTTMPWKDDIEFLPNVCFVNPADWFALTGVKTTQEMYVFPQFQNSINEVNQLGGMVVVFKNKIPAGKILTGDFTRFYIGDYIPFGIKQGYINDQLIKGQFTIQGYTRFVQYVRYYDQTKAFIYDDIANVISGIQQTK